MPSQSGAHNSSVAPPAKKQKVGERNTPITFTSPHKRPDTCIVVFGQEFHVQSEALQLHTVFFQRFLDPVNVSGSSQQTTGGWKYEWFTKVESPSDWVLSSASEDRDSNTSTYGNPEIQVKAFENLLSALFGRQVKLHDAADLTSLTNLADYYLCLPVVSNACYETLFDNPTLNNSISKNAPLLLSVACKLRHKILFRECLIHTVGTFSLRLSKDHFSNPKLHDAVATVINRSKAILYSVGKEILEMQCDPKTYNDAKKGSLAISEWVYSMTEGCHAKASDGKTRISMPMYYRRLLQNDYPKEITNATFKRILDPIMKNNLKMDTSGVGPGEGKFRNHFLFMHIEDSELPWECSQTDF